MPLASRQFSLPLHLHLHVTTDQGTRLPPWAHPFLFPITVLFHFRYLHLNSQILRSTYYSPRHRHGLRRSRTLSSSPFDCLPTGPDYHVITSLSSSLSDRPEITSTTVSSFSVTQMKHTQTNISTFFTQADTENGDETSLESTSHTHPHRHHSTGTAWKFLRAFRKDTCHTWLFYCSVPRIITTDQTSRLSSVTYLRSPHTTSRQITF